MDSPLLLFARTVVEARALAAFSAWYDQHLPRRMRARGFLSCTRFERVGNPCEIIALYLIENASYLEPLLSENLAQRDPALIEAIRNPSPEGIVNITTGIYSFASLHPKESVFMQSDGVLFIETWGWKNPEDSEALDRSYDVMYLDHLLEYPDHTAAFRLKRFEHPIIEYTNRASVNLSIVESPIDMSADQIVEMPLRPDKAQLFKDRKTGLYIPISKHWPSGGRT